MVGVRRQPMNDVKKYELNFFGSTVIVFRCLNDIGCTAVINHAMKSNPALVRKKPAFSDEMSGAPGEADAIFAEHIAAPKHLRRLKWNELVTRGDFVANGGKGFQPWEGPAGFRADAFVKPIYRRSRGTGAAS